MKRGTFKEKTYEEKLVKIKAKQIRLTKVPKPKKKSATGQITTKKRKKKTDLAKRKEQLWKLCREIQIKRYGSDCYTCDSKNLEGSSRHLGHFIPSSICSTSMRYDLDNLRVQCYSCNINKSGNWPVYERNLIRDGIDVQELKDRNEKTKNEMYRENWYVEKIENYQRLSAMI